MDGDARVPADLGSARERLLQAALETFASVGFEAAGTRAIAAQAGVRQGLVRHHFGSKAGLFEAVLNAQAARLEHDLEGYGVLTVQACLDLLRRHALLARLAAHALLAPGAPRALVRARLSPLLQRVAELHRAAEGQAIEPELRARLWLAAAFAASLEPDQTRAGDALFAWLCARPASTGLGPFSAHAARARLRA